MQGWEDSLGESITKVWQNEQVSANRFYMPILVTWKVQEIPDLKAAIWSNVTAGKRAGDTFTINCSVKNLTDEIINTYYGVSVSGQGWDPPSEYYVPNGDVGPDNVNFTFQATMPSYQTQYHIFVSKDHDSPTEEADWS